MNTKAELRTYWLEHRLTLGELQKLENSHEIQQLFFNNFPLADVKYVHVFLSIHERCEVRTWNLISTIWKKNAPTQVCLPRITSMVEGKMESVLLEQNLSIKINKWGLEEPEGGQVIPPSEIDMVLLPLITFDKNGHRLGYGGGFYDRYLAQCIKATKIGLSYFEPINELPEINQYDIPMDYCITPHKIHKFSN